MHSQAGLPGDRSLKRSRADKDCASSDIVAQERLCVTSAMESLTVISDFVSSVAQRLNLDGDQTFALQVAVDEACTNVIEYAYEGRTDGEICIALCKSEDQAVVVTIQDYGRSFDPDSVVRPDTTAPLHKRQEGGLGLFLMERLMDSVHFAFDPRRGNILTMRKGKATQKVGRLPTS